jgi:hypothetical protein
MKITAKHFIPWLSAVAAVGALALAPVASADTSPLVPYGTDPHVPYTQGIHISNHDEANQSAGALDQPF